MIRGKQKQLSIDLNDLCIHYKKRFNSLKKCNFIWRKGKFNINFVLNQEEYLMEKLMDRDIFMSYNEICRLMPNVYPGEPKVTLLTKWI